MPLSPREVDAIAFHLGREAAAVRTHLARAPLRFTDPGPATRTRSAARPGDALVRVPEGHGFSSGARVLFGGGELAEVVTLQRATARTLTAHFSHPHPAGAPLAPWCELAQARVLAAHADRAWRRVFHLRGGPDTARSAESLVSAWVVYSAVQQSLAQLVGLEARERPSQPSSVAVSP